MPVKFYPSKPIDLLENYIIKDDGSPLFGEIDIYKKLYYELTNSQEEWHVWHDLKLPTHSDTFNTYQKTSAQIDFLILSKEGIIVLEVKGGAVSLRENTFYYGKNHEIPMSQDPFRQAEGYKFTLKDKILNNVGKCFFCYAVLFPHVDYSFNSKLFDKKLLWTKYEETQYDTSLEQFIISVFSYSKNQHKKYYRTYPNLNQQEIDAVKKVLSPIVTDKNKYDINSTLEWLKVNNLEILEGLYKNKRIMIEGPPGSGKTTIAKAFIDQQLGKRGLYLCWNNLLMHSIKKILTNRERIEDIEVTTLIRFLKALNPKINLEHVFNLSEDEFYDLIKILLEQSNAENQLPIYDFIVVDEGQDVFDRGIDLIINYLTGYKKNGLQNGTALVLYDIDQSYLASGRNVYEISDLLSEYFAHYKLNEIKRSAQSPDIKHLSKLAFENPEALLQINNSTNISISKHRSLENIKKYIVNNFLSQLRNEASSLRGGQCVILIESTLLKDRYKDEPGMPFWLTIRDIEELNESNISDTSNKLRYTSILKFKGLEKENVFLIVTKPSEKNKYEIYIGITRAICNLEILIVE